MKIICAFSDNTSDRIKHHFIPVIIFVIFLFSCSSLKITAEPACPDSGTDPVTFIIDDNGKFCDDDTYIIKKTGLADKKFISIDEKRNRAKSLAVLDAQYRLIEVFAGNRIETWSPMYEPPEEYLKGQVLWKNALVKIIKSGAVLSESYDNDQNCTIIYVIHKKNLREWKDIPFEKYTGGEE